MVGRNNPVNGIDCIGQRDGTNTVAACNGAMPIRGDNTYFTPVAPVDRPDRPACIACQRRGSCVLQRTGCGITGLSSIAGEGVG